MKEVWFFYLSAILIIAAYLFGQNDNMESVVYSCQTKNQFIADGLEFSCYNLLQ